jgi:hypothetical protein
MSDSYTYFYTMYIALQAWQIKGYKFLSSRLSHDTISSQALKNSCNLKSILIVIHCLEHKLRPQLEIVEYVYDCCPFTTNSSRGGSYRIVLGKATPFMPAGSLLLSPLRGLVVSPVVVILSFLVASVPRPALPFIHKERHRPRPHHASMLPRYIPSSRTTSAVGSRLSNFRTLADISLTSITGTST